MPEAIHILGRVGKNESVTLMARILGADGSAITQATLSAAADAITYTVYKLDDDDPDTQTAITGHVAVEVPKASAIFDTLQTDALWGDTDETGYNFRHTIDVSSDQAFAVRGARYLIRFDLVPVSGQKITAKFEPECT